jgi:hypothetical protein
MAYNYLKEKFTNLASKTGKNFDIEKSLKVSFGKIWKLVLKGKILIPQVSFI